MRVILALAVVILAATAALATPPPTDTPAAAAASSGGIMGALSSAGSALSGWVSPNQEGGNLDGADDDDDVGADAPEGFLDLFCAKFWSITDTIKGFFVNMVNPLPTADPNEYVEGEMVDVNEPGTPGNGPKTRSIPLTRIQAASEEYRGAASAKFLTCEWKSEFGQPKILSSHPLWGDKINMWFYGLDVTKLPANVAGKTYAEDAAWTAKLLGGCSSGTTTPGLCNSFKPGDDAKVQYASCYSGKYKTAIYVAETLTQDLTAFGCKDGCVRYDAFCPDSRLGTDQLISDDWTGTSMDRGHLSPNADSNTTPQRMCTFYTTNIFMQTDLRNRMVWAAIEDGMRDSLYDKKKFAQVQFDHIEIYSTLVYTMPGIPGADKIYTITTRRKSVVPVPYFVFKYVIACTKTKTCLINICFLDNPDPNTKGSQAGTLTDPMTPPGVHVHKCPKSSVNAKAHCVALDDPRPIATISPCFDSTALGKTTAAQLVTMSQLDFSAVQKAVTAKGYKAITNAAMTTWTG